MVKLGRHFGMRFKEAALFRPDRDIRGNLAWITRGSKGGRPRFVPIETDQQKRLIAQIKGLIKIQGGSLLDPEAKYITWNNRMYRKLRKGGISRDANTLFHDLRRSYVFFEYWRLRAKGLSHEEAMKCVAKRVGHNRVEVLRAYIQVPAPGVSPTCGATIDEAA